MLIVAIEESAWIPENRLMAARMILCATSVPGSSGIREYSDLANDRNSHDFRYMLRMPGGLAARLILSLLLAAAASNRPRIKRAARPPGMRNM